MAETIPIILIYCVKPINTVYGVIIVHNISSVVLRIYANLWTLVYLELCIPNLGKIVIIRSAPVSKILHITIKCRMVMNERLKNRAWWNPVISRLEVAYVVLISCESVAYVTHTVPIAINIRAILSEGTIWLIGNPLSNLLCREIYAAVPLVHKLCSLYLARSRGSKSVIASGARTSAWTRVGAWNRGSIGSDHDYFWSVYVGGEP